LKANMDEEAEIAAYVALQQFLEDKKILRLPIQ
jgi:hypothetical protein